MNPDYITDEMQAKACLEWFACDEDGSIAWFESCGYAPLPESVRLSDRDRCNSIELVKQLEPRTIPIRYPSLFTKDERASSYERATGPATPIHLDQLPRKPSERGPSPLHVQGMRFCRSGYVGGEADSRTAGSAASLR